MVIVNENTLKESSLTLEIIAYAKDYSGFRGVRMKSPGGEMTAMGNIFVDEVVGSPQKVDGILYRAHSGKVTVRINRSMIVANDNPRHLFLKNASGTMEIEFYK
jgi:hypothetical protein